MPGIPAGGQVVVAIERGELVLTKPGVGRMAGSPVAEVQPTDLSDGTWRLTQGSHEAAVLAPIDVDPATLAAALANQSDATS